MEDIKKRIAGLESELSALKAAVGVDKYTDGEAFGNPQQDFDDKSVNLGGKEGPGDKKTAFVAMMKKKYNGGM